MSAKTAPHSRRPDGFLAAIEYELDREVTDAEAMEVWQAYLRRASVQETVAKIRGKNENR